MLNQNQLEALLSRAANQLGTTPDTLKQAAQSGELEKIVGGMNTNDAEAFKRVLSDKDAANKLLSSAQAQTLIQMLLNSKGGK